MHLQICPQTMKRTRLLAGLSQRALAAKVGVHPITLCRYENGQLSPRPDTIARIARALRVQVADIADLVEARDEQARA